MRTWMRVGAALVATLPLVVACGDEKQRTTRRGTTDSGGGGTSDNAPAPAASGAFPKDKATATIKGVCKWDGAEPAQKRLQIAGDDFCEKCYPDEKPVGEKYEVDKESGGVPHVFVEVKGAEKWTFDVPPETIKIDQVNCRYVPHVVGMMAGQKLTVGSSDATTHNVHFVGRLNRVSNPNSSQNKGDTDEYDLKRAELAKFKCDIHGWMECHVHVKKHMLFAVSDAKGNFELPKLPAGDYEIVAWHENRRWKTEPVKVTVADGETKEITIKVSGK